MSETLARYRSLADDLSARVDAVKPDDWANPSPCDEWTEARWVGPEVDLGQICAGVTSPWANCFRTLRAISSP